MSTYFFYFGTLRSVKKLSLLLTKQEIEWFYIEPSVDIFLVNSHSTIQANEY